MVQLCKDELSSVSGAGGSCVAFEQFNCVGGTIDLGIISDQQECSKMAGYMTFGGWLIGKPAKSFKFNGSCINFNLQTQTYLQTQG